MMEERQDFENFQDMLDEGEIPIWGVRVLWVSRPDGTVGMEWCRDGEAEAAQFIGALESLQQETILDLVGLLKIDED